MNFTPTQRRILEVLKDEGPIRTMSGLAYAVFPRATYRSPQGAALNISRHVRPLIRAALVTDWAIGPAEFSLTTTGRDALAALLNLEEKAK
ncbi:hypothetical protein [Paraburkholderia domus]|uniref:hypothetical protein n=1 Tax=Paraburkholderia domus TaxID=2793075 RepID=UPI001911A0BE|nr:hypothetical protein [Paraburkholderia domus]MBK5064838.1 hypothetical protein [Burkholderia sp. R-70199]CAE6967447.1 hypothetical protein R70199_07847 [Paraburkholderia domus]